MRAGLSPAGFLSAMTGRGGRGQRLPRNYVCWSVRLCVWCGGMVHSGFLFAARASWANNGGVGDPF